MLCRTLLLMECREYHEGFVNEYGRSSEAFPKKTSHSIVLTNPAVSVVIPCRNEANHIASALRSVFAQISPEGGFEVIVADGMSDDGTKDTLIRLAVENPSLRLVDNPGRIVSTGLNQAIRVARGHIIVRMDAHTEYAPDYIARCIETLKTSGADNVGGPWQARGRSYLQSAIALAFHSPFSSGGAGSHQSSHEGPVDSVYLGCWRKETLFRLGTFR